MACVGCSLAGTSPLARAAQLAEPMKILVINVGSTSVKYDLYQMDTEQQLAHGVIERIDTSAAVQDAVAALATRLGDQLRGLAAVGHRVVHGGERLIHPVLIDAGVEQMIADCATFAPLHNPLNLLGIRAARAAFPDVPHVAVFDTAFHAAMPERSFLYGLPYQIYLERGVRRFGFHGPSHQYMAACAAEELHVDVARTRLVTCHLGGGSSVAAIDGGVSIDTSMGMTPLEGLIMDTRPGDLETVDLIGPRGELHGVAIINPLRAETQIELARTDGIRIGIDPPLRLSGELASTPGLTLRGPRGEVTVDHGVIVAQRHVHMSPDDARRFGVADRDVIRVEAAGEREAVLGDVVVRVSPSFALDLHLDTDEANATGLVESSVVAFAGRARGH
jgi:propanediol utilization protein